MHDCQIVAAALQLNNGADQVALLTRDESIQQSNLVPTIW